jgi:integrase
LFRLQWQDLDFERGFIYIRYPKGGQDQKIPLNEPARALLRLRLYSDHIPARTARLFSPAGTEGGG